jgi:Spy/CpxP family protein refolding chaperone
MMNSLKRRFGRAGALVLCAVALCVMPMRAQDTSAPPQGQGGQGHWGGHGGPGPVGGRNLGMLTKQLDLSPDQVSQIKGIYADEGTQMKALHEDTSTAQADKRQKMFSIRKDSHERFLAVLSPDQKTKLEAFEAKMKERRSEHGHGNGSGSGSGSGSVSSAPASAPTL